jgi:hypothetical protein
MANNDATNFENDIRPMFTDMDVDHMQAFGIDLSSAASVKEHAAAIYATVSQGSMPPPGSGEARWTPEMCERFKRWMEQG